MTVSLLCHRHCVSVWEQQWQHICEGQVEKVEGWWHYGFHSQLSILSITYL